MRALALGLCLLAGLAGARAAEPVTELGVVLLQPSAVLEERVPSVDAMADYIKAVQAASREAVLGSAARQSVGGFIVVAVRPGPQSHVWLDFDALLDLELRKQILDKVAAVKPFEAVKGPVVFALKVSLWNGRPPKRAAPLPPEWKKATGNGERPDVGQLVDRIWNE